MKKKKFHNRKVTLKQNSSPVANQHQKFQNQKEPRKGLHGGVDALQD